jgi:glutamate mutase epsilon subunit
MKNAALTLIALGLLSGLLATLTAVEALPHFLIASSGFSAVFLTTVFWVCLSGLLVLSAIALGIISVFHKEQ